MKKGKSSSTFINTSAILSQKLLICLYGCLPLSVSALCNVVNKNPQLSYVTVVNGINKELAVTGDPGFYLQPNETAETMLLPGAGNLVQVTPNPYSYYDQEKQLSCNFSTAVAKKYQIIITYNLNDYEVLPREFKNNCTFKIVKE